MGCARRKDKAFCTVLDFVGQHRKEFRFDRRYRALLGGTRRDVERAVQMQFPFLPVGCNMQLDEKSAEVVLRSLREALPVRWKAKVDELRSLRQVRPDIDLAGFLDESGLDLDDLYANNRSWSELLDATDAPTLPAGPRRRRCDERSDGSFTSTTPSASPPTAVSSASDAAPRAASCHERTRRLLHMLVASLTDQAITKDSSVQDAIDLLWAHPQVASRARLSCSASWTAGSTTCISRS